MSNNKDERVMLTIMNKNNDKPAMDFEIITEKPDFIMKHGHEQLGDATALLVNFMQVLPDMEILDQMKFFKILAKDPIGVIEEIKEAFHKNSYIVFKKL